LDRKKGSTGETTFNRCQVKKENGKEKFKRSEWIKDRVKVGLSVSPQEMKDGDLGWVGEPYTGREKVVGNA